VASELLRILIQSKLFETFRHRLLLGIEPLPGARLLRVELLHKLQELPVTPLLQQSHQTLGERVSMHEKKSSKARIHSLEVMASCSLAGTL
jgi:hypothetical protein